MGTIPSHYGRKKMFVGSCYALTASAEGQTILGYPHLQIAERVLSRTETRSRKEVDQVKVTVVKTTSYYYTLLCIVGGDEYDCAEIDEEELQSEIISGYYQLVPDLVQL
jgi:hypothetical protein|tara:strand:- start:793 stop:1119 length:327 start_codon:yes stop_codon:yes gene_type:complete